MNRTLRLALVALLAASPLAAHIQSRTVAQLSACGVGAPAIEGVTDGASVTDCETGGGGFVVACLCSGGLRTALPWPVHSVVGDLPICTNGSPLLVYVTDGASGSDCATGAGTTEVPCSCEDGVWGALGAGAPADAEYVVGAANGSLSAERVGTDTAEVDWDFGTAAQAKLNLINDSIIVPRLATSDIPADDDVVMYEATGTEVKFYTPSEVLDIIGSTRGSILYRGASAWAALTPGTTDYPLVSNGAGADPAYEQLVAAGIASDAVTEPKLKAVDAATDEECLTYETTTGDFEWQSCLLSATGADQYLPERPPTSPHACTDEFNDGFEESWVGYSVGTSTWTALLDGAILEDLTAGGANNVDAYYVGCTEPTDSFAIIVKMSAFLEDCGASCSGMAGINILETGTETTPTKLIQCDIFETAGIFGVRGGTRTSYTSARTGFGGSVTNLYGTDPGIVTVWIKAEYDDAGDTFKCYGSTDGYVWSQANNTYTLTTDPPAFGVFVNNFDISSTYFHAFRVRTDAQRAQASDDP